MFCKKRWLDRRWITTAAALVGVALGAVASAPGTAAANNASGALVESADCTQNVLNRNDDGSSVSVDLPFELDFYGQRYGGLWVNNNGNVTFDSPLSTYTPFGLQAVQRSIIAPYFADVDTRGSGSDVVRYGYGMTTFEGRRAFCVNWINVGYYNARSDKLNSFQLLLVERDDRRTGDFDIVFNYGSVDWETGDASGGTNGLGGESARVGFANGDNTRENSYELPGSGISGLLLDSNPRGLVNGSIKSPQLGRYVYAISNGQPTPDQYVAIGDSYQSGEGAGDYSENTDDDNNQCHRSANAYPWLLTREPDPLPLELKFVACSGAVIDDLTTTEIRTDDVPYNEGAQLDNLNDSTALATVGIGGNDLDFSGTLKGCVTVQSLPTGSCEDAYDDDVVDRLLALQDRSGPNGLNRFQRLYDTIRSKAPRGKVLVLGYPRIFAYDGGDDFSSILDILPNDGRCNNIRVSDQIWMNEKIKLLNSAIESSARSMGARNVSLYEVSDGNEVCADDPAFFNGLKLPTIESFHPTGYGHERIADAIRTRLFDAPDSDPFPGMASVQSAPSSDHDPESIVIEQDQRIERSRTVEESSSVTFATEWPGSDVVMTLRSPSGRVYTRDTPLADGFYHRAGSTQEIYLINDPEPGRWTIELFGAQVRQGGEPTTFTTYEAPKPNRGPTARITQTTADRNVVALDAGTSTDADGQVVDYLWDFGDGEYAVGPRVTHRYAEPGAYRVTLVVKDNQGALGFDTASQDFTITPYQFNGFAAPVDNPPIVNAMNAGRSVPVKFSLKGDQGLEIFDPGYPKVQRVDCASGAALDEIEQTQTAGSSSLTYSSSTDTYTYVWRTEQAWAGSCRQLVLGLDDSTEHVADFRFR